jgi:tetratricopeptide (TPR) repeat protein
VRWLLPLVSSVALGCGGAKAPNRPPPLAPAAYAHYLDGKLYAYREDWPAAADALAAAAAAAPDQPLLAVELARAQHHAKRNALALATLDGARKKWPKHPLVWAASGDLLAQSNAVQAIAAYRRAIELEPTEERAYLGLAKLEKDPAALATLRRLVAKVPASVDGHYLLAQRLAPTDRDAAVVQLRAVLELDPDHIDARIDLARVLRMQGKLAAAIVETRSAFDRSGQALELAEELFWLLCEADDRTAAIDLLTLLDDDHSDNDALATVARLDRTLGRLDEARAIAARIAKTDATAGAIVIAEVEIAAGEPEAAAKRMLAVPETSEHFVDARRVAASALLAAQAPQRALDAIAPARAQKPESIELATQAAFALVDLGKRGEAEALLATLGDKPLAIFARARLADHAGDPAAALARVEPLARAKPDFIGALNLAGYLLADQNQRLADAERYLKKARELAPGDPAIMDSWGWLLLRKGQTKPAIKALDLASRISPREAEILLHLAQAWLAAKNPRTALALLDRATAAKPSPAVKRRIDAVRQALTQAR